MSNQPVAQRFDAITLERLAEIIANYTGAEITRFFERAGFPEFRHDGSTKKYFVYGALQTVQERENGSSKIICLIEEFCNPKAHIDESWLVAVNDLMADYDLTITKSGKVAPKVRLSEAVDTIESLARRFYLVAHQLTHRHDNRSPFIISDEYDVQDLFHAMLHMFFDDIRPEEWTPSYGGGHSRVDFLLKREKIVVEIKKTRAGLTKKELGDQLLIDKGRYHTHPDCKILIVFVYDPDKYVSNPRGFEDDLSQPINNLYTKVIVSQS